MDLFHGGLEQFIGQPHPDIMDRMAWEHKGSPYSNTPFQNSTNGTSTAAREYDYVVHFSGEPENTEKGRDGYSIDTLWVHGTKSMGTGSYQREQYNLRREDTGVRFSLFDFGDQLLSRSSIDRVALYLRNVY